MKHQTPQHESLSVVAALPPLQPTKRQLILRYNQTRPRGTQDITHSHGSAFALGVEAYCLSQGYQRLQDAIPGIVQVWDRGYDSVTKKPKPDKYLVVVHVEGYELVFIIESISLYHNFAADHLLVVPILPEILRTEHGISC